MLEDPLLTTRDVHEELLQVVTSNILFSTSAEIWHLDDNWALRVVAQSLAAGDPTALSALRISRISVTGITGQSSGKCHLQVVIICGKRRYSTSVLKKAKKANWTAPPEIKLHASLTNVRIEVYHCDGSRERELVAHALVGVPRLGHGQCEITLQSANDNQLGMSGTMTIPTVTLESEWAPQLHDDDAQEVKLRIIGAKGLAKVRECTPHTTVRDRFSNDITTRALQRRYNHPRAPFLFLRHSSTRPTVFRLLNQGGHVWAQRPVLHRQVGRERDRSNRHNPEHPQPGVEARARVSFRAADRPR